MPGRYHRLPLPAEGAPLEEQFDAFIGFLRVSRGKAPGPWGHGGLGFAPVPEQARRVGERDSPRASSSVFGFTLPVRGCPCLRLHPVPIAVDPAGEFHVVQLLVPTAGWR